MTPDPLDALAPHATLYALLAHAGEELLRWADGSLAVRTKGDGSPVTEADLASERVLLAGLLERWPDDGIVSEEGARRAGTSGAHWVVDPLDGTSAFVEGLAHWGPTVARIDTGRVTEGAILLPRTGEFWYVRDGVALHGRNGVPVRMSAGRHEAAPVLLVPSELHRIGHLRWDGKARCLGGTAAHLGLVARGSARAAIVAQGWSVWDVAAGLALIDASGGKACALADGQALSLTNDGPRPAFVAGDPTVVDALRRSGAWRTVAASER